MSRRSEILVGVRVVMTWLVMVGVLVILGIFLGWRLPVAATFAYALFLLRLHTGPHEPGRLRTAVEFVVFAVIGTALGVLAWGALGGIFGCAFGVTARLAEVPVTGLHPWSRRRSKPER